MLNEILIAKEIKNGNVNTFEKLFREHYFVLHLYAVSITKQTEIAEEIVQDVFYILWRDRESLGIFKSIKSYLYVSVRNRCFQHIEHRNVRLRHEESIINEKEEPFLNPSEQIEYEELATIINKALEKMPKRRQQIFEMHRFDGMKYTEIANSFSISIKTVEAEITKALKTLRKEVEYYKYRL